MTVGAFYLPVGENEFESTSATASPWDFSLQHGGPPAALLTRAMQRCGAGGATPLARVTVDFLGGIPQGRLRTEARVLRPGRRVELLEAELWADGKLAVQASAWRIRQQDGATAAVATPAVLPPPLPAPAAGWPFGGISRDWGYGNAIEWRFVAGGFADPGPASVWTRVRIPLVDGEESTPEQRAMIVADSANGLSGELPMADWLFIPPTLSVTFQRAPESAWMFLDAASSIGPNGTGIAQGTITDERGLVCRISQPLLVAPR
ncbi:acyl-coenzyme A thioesterase PaaI-like protein [Actinoplanes octamycinicus]|uniref:Acyl-coenzyme A thioesterase PaaI-like protein n=1 Tax=Actinoplanes octamycinicus TaxID=135948 RepID=A0A7W7M833_9ACTN|nr:thioesterase family protein [Actinoplanes octamycinicus]MBB4740445.1 acyl-coenzyme A thioesterase PaaI-like protein [Actinoplanes octamycinicus]GIE59706.1 hypothetical protein Aoc01nite_51080 [Actinoplanes octamycinicus]